MMIGLSLSMVGQAVQTLLSPAFSLDMLLGTLDPRITFTRADATTCATYFGSDGRLATAAANVPRFDYDPVTPAGTTGVELVTNGTFASGATGWTSVVTGPSTITYNSNSVSFYRDAGGQDPEIRNIGTATIGKTYYITFDVVSASNYASNIGVTFNAGLATYPLANLTSAGTKTFFVVATATGVIGIKHGGAGPSTVTISNISVQQVTFASIGLRVEESRANLLANPRDFTQASWVKSNVTTTHDQLGIDGVANAASKVLDTAVYGSHVFQSNTATTVSTTYTFSAVLKQSGSLPWVLFGQDVAGVGFFSFNLTTGAFGSTTAGTYISRSVINEGGGWWRVSITYSAANTTSGGAIFISGNGDSSSPTYTGTGTNGFIIDCAQLEVGSFATSIIPSQSTRAADVNVSTANIPGATGTVVISAVAPNNSSSTQVLYSIDDGTSANRFTITRAASGTIGAQWIVANTLQASLNSVASVSGNSAFKVAVAWSAGNFALSLNGATPVTASSGSIPTVTSRRLGMNFSNGQMWNSTIKSVAEYSSQLPNSTLQALST